MNLKGKIFIGVMILVWIGVSYLVVMSVAKALEVAVERYEHNKCRELSIQSETYEGFFYADWEKEMCGIK